MISFKPITEENLECVISSVAKDVCPAARDNAREILEGLSFDADGVEFAVCIFSNCLLIRIFDMGRYYFSFPYEIGEKADVYAAVEEIRKYTLREEIPLTFVDAPYDTLSIFKGYRHMDIDAEDEDGETYRVKIKTECELLDKIPELTYGRVKLNEISETDVSLYAKLCKDENVNKYWGYNYKDDVKNPSDDYFFENARREFNSGVGICFAIRVGEKFVGETELYAFDGKGVAEFSVRLFSEEEGKGYGTESVYALMDVGRKMGLVALRTSVMRENVKSVAMLDKICDERTEDANFITFTIYLY